MRTVRLEHALVEGRVERDVLLTIEDGLIAAISSPDSAVHEVSRLARART